MAGKQKNPSHPKYRVYGSIYEIRKELEALVVFAGSYDGLMKDSLIYRIKVLNSVLND